MQKLDGYVPNVDELKVNWDNNICELIRKKFH